MSRSLSRVLPHIIFSTKNRFAFLTDSELQKRMHAYLARVFNEHDSPACVCVDFWSQFTRLCRRLFRIVVGSPGADFLTRKVCNRVGHSVLKMLIWIF